MKYEPSQLHYASDKVRWYYQDGRSATDCLSAKGLPKSITLREARKENLIPSVTSIVALLDKPALGKWKAEQYLKAAWDTINQPRPWDRDEFVAASIQNGDATMDLNRDKGSEVHGNIDLWLKAGCPEPDSPHLEAARSALIRLGVYGQPFKVERSFTALRDGVWVAGKTDLAFDFTIVDWKIVDRLDKKKDWMERQIQLGAYANALFGGSNPCHNVFIDAQTAQFEIRTWDSEELETGWQIYRHLFHVWTLLKGYFPKTISGPAGHPGGSQIAPVGGSSL